MVIEITYLGTGGPLVSAIDASNYVGASSGWEPQWWGIAQRAVDGSTVNKASSTTGFEGQDQWVSVAIDPYYDIKRVHVHYNKFKNRDGSDRKLSRMRVIRLSGKVRPENIAYGFRENWKSYQDA